MTSFPGRPPSGRQGAVPHTQRAGPLVCQHRGPEGRAVLPRQLGLQHLACPLRWRDAPYQAAPVLDQTAVAEQVRAGADAQGLACEVGARLDGRPVRHVDRPVLRHGHAPLRATISSARIVVNAGSWRNEEICRYNAAARRPPGGAHRRHHGARRRRDRQRGELIAARRGRGGRRHPPRRRPRAAGRVPAPAFHGAAGRAAHRAGGHHRRREASGPLRDPHGGAGVARRQLRRA